MTVSIIVALKGDNPNLRECIEHCLKLDYSDFEILVLPDKELALPYPKTTVIPTGNISPPLKRDLAIEKSRGEILAFLDDDTYPAPDWLGNALLHFQDSTIAAVGGPAITPESDTLLQKASGLVYASWLVSGPYSYRYLAQKKRYVDDYPSCNFLVRKDVMREIGGFNTKFWPGEDTFLCLKIVKDLKKKIIYDPKVLVYHHRRSLFKGHLKQINAYALHRGYFVKKFPQTSFKFTYFLPSFLVLGLFFGIVITLLNPALTYLYSFLLFFYLAIVLTFTIFQISPPHVFRLIFLVFWGIIFSHLVYGIWFIRGLLAKKMPEEE